jgi:hypothetical protein
MTCETCGATVEDGDPARLAWSVEPGRGALCPGCAREHVRDIEARLPREWWRSD